MKFGQLIEHNRVIKSIELQEKDFLQKICRKWGKKTCLRPYFIFSKKT